MHVNCQLKRKRGAFTLIEMLIVVVVLVTLMSMVFRLSSIGDESTCRVNTVERMQKLENCLSGYYAAFGCYPPVPLHGSHDIYFRVAFKPVATLLVSQPTVDKAGHDTTLQARGRHDPCVVLRAVPVVEAAVALCILDLLEEK